MFKQITYNPEPEVIGVNNGIYQLEFKGKELKKNRNYKEIEKTLLASNIDNFLQEQNKIYNLEIKNLKAKLLKKAKLTDIMVFSPFFFGYKYIVSQKFVDYLEEEKVNKDEYHLREIDIIDIDINYYLLFIPMIPNSEINFSKSLVYFEQEDLLSNKEYVNIDNHKEYKELLNEDPFMSFEKICLNRKHEKKSIINIQGANDLFFSDNLLKKIQAKKITNFIVPNRQIELVFD